MTKKIRSIPMKFDPIALGNDILVAQAHIGLTNRDVATLAEISTSQVSRLVGGYYSNIETNTLTRVCNALELDPRKYFVLDV